MLASGSVVVAAKPPGVLRSGTDVTPSATKSWRSLPTSIFARAHVRFQVHTEDRDVRNEILIGLVVERELQLDGIAVDADAEHPGPRTLDVDIVAVAPVSPLEPVVEDARGVDDAHAAFGSVLPLPVTVVAPCEAVFPADVVPVVDMKTDRRESFSTNPDLS